MYVTFISGSTARKANR